MEVLVPNRMPAELIDRFIQDKRGWIEKKLYFNREIRTAFVPKTFTSGEAFLLLGANYRLRVQQGKRSIELYGHELLVSHPAPDPESTKRQIVRWYRQQAETHFSQRCRELAQKTGKHPIHVGVKAYKSRWGSCHHDGRIYFNWRLIMAPAWVIDDVVVHELCHLIHPNHSSQFWALVQSISPMHTSAKSWLTIHGQSLAV